MFTIKSQKGFTLIEMMIVLLIISVLVLIAIPNVTKHSSTIDQKGCEAFINTIVDKRILAENSMISRVERMCLKGLINLATITHIKRQKIKKSCVFELDGNPIRTVIPLFAPVNNTYITS
ncbi:prepilin-type N-terminal cleavage/methylation domain-containing protein [Sporosarcina saromensis]|uniref:Prepilin-type N-terminal cleavage/methylation domain-containing protein n=1 Tax=Sporosarcina saromensis TaxID=359365 RepID=A0ABU4G5E5_9BACL|nr:prepilin-type N-terminal cleavage/methylation domain-containing protein [Sporosarcina saromensis]MDW0112190.1 prepilin-type N-terminal cleavage/methylation domain-containing protein [Sporosarcina saromensis]